MSTGTAVNYEFVNRAFGGIQLELDESDSDLELESYLEESQRDIDPDEPDERVQSIHLVRSSRLNQSSEASESADDDEDEDSSVEGPEAEDENENASDSSADDDDDDDVDEAASDNWDFDLGEDSDDSERIPLTVPRKARREEVEPDAPCSSHTRVYRGHCNIKTVKDVNFFGLNDEYVVSGSDSGHVFIWNRKDGKLLNILEGDSEVVNVVQGKQSAFSSDLKMILLTSHRRPPVRADHGCFRYRQHHQDLQSRPECPRTGKPRHQHSQPRTSGKRA